jgi:hemoglobin
MKGRSTLLVSLVAGGCMFGGGGGSQTETAAPSPGPVAAPAAPAAPQATQPWSPADPPPRQAAPAPATPARTPGLYTRLGGLAAIRSVVDTMLARVAADERINAFFRGVNMDTLRLHLVEQICEATGGPCRYRGRTMPVAHQGLNLTDAHFNALVEDLAASLDVHRVAARERGELLTALGRMRPQIVGQ